MRIIMIIDNACSTKRTERIVDQLRIVAIAQGGTIWIVAKLVFFMIFGIYISYHDKLVSSHLLTSIIIHPYMMCSVLGRQLNLKE